MNKALSWISKKGYDINLKAHLAGTQNVELTFNELAQLLEEYAEEKANVKQERVVCTACSGSGKYCGRDCGACDGTGFE